jgi:hypothetical protein
VAVAVAVADRGPVPVALPLRTDELVDLMLSRLAQHAEPDLD